LVLIRSAASRRSEERDDGKHVHGIHFHVGSSYRFERLGHCNPNAQSRMTRDAARVRAVAGVRERGRMSKSPRDTHDCRGLIVAA
jgi:hypothetical protein